MRVVVPNQKLEPAIMNLKWLSLILFSICVLILPSVLFGQAPVLQPQQKILVDGITNQITTIEWLAPLAPIALSPFFGITLLSGFACYGAEWLPARGLIGPESPLANPTLFWICLTLTVATSLPRFSKVSKPVAQIADFLETYASIIVLVGIRLLSSFATEAQPEPLAFVQLGGITFGYDILIAIAMALNILVINTVKFFFEILVWITPVPALDACFEIANKMICAGLMLVYAFSPFIAMLINGLLFLACLFIFSWVRRRELFFRCIIIDAIMGKINPNRGRQIPERLVVFPAFNTGAIKRRSRCHLRQTDEGFELSYRRWLRSTLVETLTGAPVIEKDFWTNSLNFPDGVKLTFTTRYNEVLDQLSKQFNAELSDLSHLPTDGKKRSNLEFR